MKNNLLLLLICCSSFLFSCEDEIEFGEALIYMPQATHNIGTDCNLTVNLFASSSPDTSIVLGVYRSGLQKLEEFTVDMVINTDTLSKAQVIAQLPDAQEVYNIYKTGVLLPSNYYEPLPSTLTVTAGNRETTTYLVLKKSLIRNNFVSGTVLILPVQIKNPTKYELNKKFSLTMVVITVM